MCESISRLPKRNPIAKVLGMIGQPIVTQRSPDSSQ